MFLAGCYWLSRKPIGHLFQLAPLLKSLNFVSVLLITLSLLLFALFIFLFGGNASYWARGAGRIVGLLTLLHFFALLGILVFAKKNESSAILSFLKNKISLWVDSSLLSILLFLFVAFLFLFRIEPGNPFFNLIFGIGGVMKLHAAKISLPLALLSAAGVVFAIHKLYTFEASLQTIDIAKLRAYQKRFVFFLIPSTYWFYFDHSLDSDLLHYLTNIGPASQVLHGGSPMVTSFSQYGLGPLLTTFFSMKFAGSSFAIVNIMTQLHNLTFYVLILICLYRMSDKKITALTLGFFAIGIQLSGWWGGDGNLNSVPSSMGLRYLPNMLMVLSLSFLGQGKQTSKWTFLAVVFSSLWSVEAFIGSVAIYSFFLLTLNLAQRTYRLALFNFLIFVFSPIVVAGFVMVAMTYIWSQQWPDYLSYLSFLEVYHMFSKHWSIQSSGVFFGWIPLFLIAVLLLKELWVRIYSPDDSTLELSNQDLFYRYIPMTVLMILMSAYYVGRSVDFTIIIAFMPFCALFIPVLISFWQRALDSKKTRHIFFYMPALVLVWSLSFSFLGLFRSNSPYSIAIHQCVHENSCTPWSQLKGVVEKMKMRPMVDAKISPSWYDKTGFIQELQGEIEQWAAGADKLVVLAGVHKVTKQSVMSDIALFNTGKWHKWPISYVLTDEFTEKNVNRILHSAVELKDGEVVILRNDESSLGLLETQLLQKIRDMVSLCSLSSKKFISSFSISTTGSCPPGGTLGR